MDLLAEQGLHVFQQVSFSFMLIREGLPHSGLSCCDVFVSQFHCLTRSLDAAKWDSRI